MNVLLRSCFKTNGENADLLFQNYLYLVDSGLGFEIPEDNQIWGFIRDFAQTYNSVPEVGTIRLFFQNDNKPTIIDRIENLIAYTPIYGGDFQVRLESKAEERRIRQVHEILNEANKINQIGLKVKENKKDVLLKGPIEAIRHIVNHSSEIVSPTLGSRLFGEITTDGDDFQKEYELRESDPLAGIGQFTGLAQMDTTLQGAKKNELWTHAAFTGGLKSTFMLNWAYNQSVFYGHSTLIFSIEMPYSQCRRILYAMHSLHPKFNDVRVKLGIQSDPKVELGLLYKKVRDAQLDKKEKHFLFNYVIPDFNGQSVVPDLTYEDGTSMSPPNGYGKIHIEVTDPDKSDFTVADIRAKAELIYSKNPFTLLCVDHAGLLSARNKKLGTTEKLNEVMRDLKRTAMNFNRGSGMAVLALFQINREGFKSAEKNGGNYNLTHLSYANEAERSSDIVTTSFVNDQLRQANRVRFQCLKSRDDAPFEPFFARVEWSCRRVLTCWDEIEIIGQEQQQSGNGGRGKSKKKVDDLIDEIDDELINEFNVN
jgi:hypothetical protein